LEEARKLYTARCTECHDLELLDSRSMDGWSRAMASMGGRAHLSDGQRGKILEYLAAAQRTLNK
jgi:cytochrome c5